MPPPPFHVGSCYLWQDASPFNPSFSLTARILSLTDDEIAVRVIRGYVDGGDPDHATLTLRSAGDKWTPAEDERLLALWHASHQALWGLSPDQAVRFDWIADRMTDR